MTSKSSADEHLTLISLSFIILVFTVWHYVHFFFCGKDAVYGLDRQEGVDYNSGLGKHQLVPLYWLRGYTQHTLQAFGFYLDESNFSSTGDDNCGERDIGL
jgi:hypothetical protein